MLYAHYGSTGGSGIDYTWDALGRKTSETSYSRAVASQYDAAGNRTRLTYPDSNYIQYTYDPLNRMLQVQQNGSAALATYYYDDLSRVTNISRSNSAGTTMSYSGTSLSWGLTQDMSGTSQDVTFSLAFTPATQVYQRSISNTAYAYSAPALTRSYSSNGLNQYASVGGVGYSYDDRGNLISNSARGLSYDLENRLISTSFTSPAVTLGYDPKGRLLQSTVTSTTQQFLYDGDSLIAEYDSSGNVLRRYVPGRGVDETLVWYEGANLSTPAWLHTDQQGTVIATSNSAGAATVYTYSPSGEPNNWNGVRFRYTGQAAIPELALYYYKARMYDPALGRFLQTDPIGYKDEWNLYAYVGNDPTNRTDSTGLYQEDVHFFLTEFLAKAAGISPSVARQIAAADQGTDSGSTGPWASFEAREDYHFTSDARRSDMLSIFEGSGSPKDLGRYLHAVQDSYSHAPYGPNIGHFWTESPDKTPNDVSKANKMAMDTYNKLVSAKGGLHQTGAAVPYSKIQGTVDRFNKANDSTDADRKAKIDTLNNFNFSGCNTAASRLCTGNAQ